MRFILSVLVLALSHASTTVLATGHHRGLPWGCDNRLAKQQLGDLLMWYHHWADGRVPELDAQGLEFVPTMWGPSKMSSWRAVQKDMRAHKPNYLLSFNEPDVPGQANLSPEAAADLWMREMQPWALKGVKVSTPQVCWDRQWFKRFHDACAKRGCKIGFVAIHWYGGDDDLDKLKSWTQFVHDLYPGKEVWVTEFGLTRQCGAGKDVVANFYLDAVQYFQDNDWITHSAWLGAWTSGNPPDNYPNPNMALFGPNGKPNSLMQIVGSVQHPGGDKNNGYKAPNSTKHPAGSDYEPVVSTNKKKKKNKKHQPKQARHPKPKPQHKHRHRHHH